MELLFAILFANDIISDKYLKGLEALIGFVSDEKRQLEEKIDALGEKVDRNYAALNMLDARFGDFLISYYNEAIIRLEDASEPTIKKNRREKLIDEARQKFEDAFSKTRTAFSLIAAKAQLGAGTCYESLNEKPLAINHYKRAYKEAESDKNYTYLKMVCQRLYPSVKYPMPDSRYNSPTNIKLSLSNLRLSVSQYAGELILNGRLPHNERLKFKQYSDNSSEVIDFLQQLAPVLILRNIYVPVEILVEIQQTRNMAEFPF